MPNAPSTRIASREDIRAYIAHVHPDQTQELLTQLEEDILASAHPEFGTDWAEWFAKHEHPLFNAAWETLHAYDDCLLSAGT